MVALSGEDAATALEQILSLGVSSRITQTAILRQFGLIGGDAILDAFEAAAEHPYGKPFKRVICLLKPSEQGIDISDPEAVKAVQTLRPLMPTVSDEAFATILAMGVDTIHPFADISQRIGEIQMARTWIEVHG